MRRSTLFLALSLLALAGSAADAVAQPLTRTRRIAGKDDRGKYEIVWLQLTERFPDAAVRARVNADLEKEALSHICRPTDGEYLEAWYQMKVTYLSAQVLGVSTGMFISCGYPNPLHGTWALLYDLRTGARIEVETEMAERRAFRRFVDRRVLANQPRDPAECKDAYKPPAGYIYIPRQRTLTVIQDYPNVVQACAYDTEIPHADIIRFLRPTSALRTLR
ncbi:MAG: hypothetical protein ACJ8GN_22710 [Longimicrobiaceae bacterium]